MNTNLINHFYESSISFLKDRAYFSLNALNRKTAVIGLVALVCLAFAYLSFCCGLNPKEIMKQRDSQTSLIPAEFQGELPVVKTQEQFEALFPSLADYISEKGTANKSGAAVCRIFLVRHGQSTANEAKINAGQTVDSPLTVLGEKQASDSAKALLQAADHFSAVYCTPLLRTKQSIQAIARVWADEKKNELLKPIEIKELIEKHCGSLEGAKEKDYNPIKEKEAEDISKLKRFADKFSYKMVPDQESLADVFQRAVPALAEIGQKHAGHDVLISTHVGVMRALIIGLTAINKRTALEVRTFELPNSAIVVIEAEDLKALNLAAGSGLTFKQNCIQ